VTLRFFAADRRGLLRKVRPRHVDAVLNGRLSAAVVGCRGVRELRLVTAVCDRRLIPRAVYLLRVPLTGGRFTAADEVALRAFASPACVTPHEAAVHHGHGWPRDLVRQLAVALDVPLAGLAVPFGAGGPVLASVAGRVPLRQAARDFRPT
jgi:hypothetical protein